MDDVLPGRKGLSKGNLEIRCPGLEGEVLITECGRPSDFIDSYDNEREIEVVGGAIGKLNRPINTIAVNLRRAKPFEYQTRRDHCLNLFADSVRRTGGVLNGHGIDESPSFCGTTDQEPVGRKRDSFRQLTRCDAPMVGRNAPASAHRDPDFNPKVEG